MFPRFPLRAAGALPPRVGGLCALALAVGLTLPGAPAATARPYEWSIESVPTRANLRAIWGSSPSAVFAAGDSGTVLRFDGTAWARLDFPFGNVPLVDLHGSSADDVYAVGGGRLYRFNGTAWAEFSPQPSGAGIISVWVNSPNQIICGGNGFITHWNGTQWAQQSTFLGFGTVADIWGVPGGDLFAVDRIAGELYRWYECSPGHRAWEQVDVKASGLRSLWGSSTTDIYAVGGRLNAVRYTGATDTMCRQPWSYSGPPVEAVLNGVWGRAADDIYMVGHYSGLTIGSYITHFDGTAWRHTPAPEGPGGMTGPTLLYAVWGDRSGDFWAVGDRGHLLRNQPTTPDTSLVVNSTACVPDAVPGDGRCETGRTTADGEPECTLCAAIQEANADPAPSVITFDIPTSDPGYRAATGSFEIAPSLLPLVEYPVTIDGDTQPGAPGRPRVELRPGGTVGLWIRGGRSTVRGLAIRNVQGTALVLETLGGNRVTGCYLGTDVTGEVDAGNQGGIFIEDSPDNTIGGRSPAEANIISGNGTSGITITGSASTGNRILGNLIGLAADGATALPNDRHGVLVDRGATGTVIGGGDADARNVISGNGSHGIAVADADDTHIIGNTIGLDRTGFIARGNAAGGIVVEDGAERTTIGGTGPNDGNLIASNRGHGIALFAAARDVRIHRNVVGMDAAGAQPRPNTGDGIHIESATLVRIGDGGEQSGNSIAANLGAGIRVREADTRDVRIEQNRIGFLAVPDTAKAPNDGGAVRVEDGVEDVTIGGTDRDDWNRIYGSVAVLGPSARRVSFLGNHIAMPPALLTAANPRLPFDLGGDGPSCNCGGDSASGTNDAVAVPHILKLSTSLVEGMSRPGATVFAYRVLGAGTGRMRYFFHALEPEGHAVADGQGRFTIPVALRPGDQVVAAATDTDGNTSEMSQLKRPVVFVHGIGGAWLEADDGADVWLPDGVNATLQNLSLRRMGFNADGTSKEPITATEMLESVLGIRTVYGPIMDWLAAHGYAGEMHNLGGVDMDAWRYWYDWRKSPSDAVGGLRTMIDRITSDDPAVARSCDVDLVVHSYGGVVANVYLRADPERARCRVHRYVTMGIPVLGTPLAAGAHTRGYIFELEKTPIFGWPTFGGGFFVRWGWMIEMGRNLPAAYALLPGEAFWSANRGNQPNHYLEDLNGTPLTSHRQTMDFLGAPKVDAAGAPTGLDRNLTLWNRELERVHARSDDWRDFQGPPQVFRIVGRIPDSAIQRWTVFGDPPSRIRYAFVTAAFSRYEPGDTYDHWSYRERLTPVLGAGDGTVLLSSATLGHAPPGGTDYSGVGRTPWIEDFEYFPCKHNDMLLPECTSGTQQCLDHLTDILDSGYRVPPQSGAARLAEAAAAAPTGTEAREIFYVRGTEPVSVRIEDGSGRYTGAPDPARPEDIVYDLKEVGYWATSQTVCLSFDPARAYTIRITAPDGASNVQVLRILSDGAAEHRNIYFPRTSVGTGGALRLVLPAGGAPASTALEHDAGGDGVFEATVSPAAEAPGTTTAPAIPLPKPWRLLATGYRTDSAPRTAVVRLPDVGGPVWTWSVAGTPPWLGAATLSGSTPDSLVFAFDARTLAAGVHEDTLVLALGLGGYTETVRIPLALTVLETPALARVTLAPDYVVLSPGDTHRFVAEGYDESGASFVVEPEWSSEGGTIAADGTFTAGPFNGVFFVTARIGSVEAQAVVEVVGGTLPNTPPLAFRLHQNFPNPCLQSTTIAFDVPAPTRVRITLYDVGGRAVATLVDADYPAGRHLQPVAPPSLAGGMYFYRAEMGGFMAVRRMVVLR